jgi:3-keto-disaccharide hydrolase
VFKKLYGMSITAVIGMALLWWGQYALAADWGSASAPLGWQPYNRGTESIEEGGRKFIRLDARSDDGVVWLKGTTFREGTIDIDLRGKDVQGQSFIGIAFRGTDNTHYDAVYFRPFNFKTDDAERKLHGVQYISLPSFPWAKLRTEHPEQYEKPVAPAPDPNGWFHARIVVEKQMITVYVNDSTTSALNVVALSAARSGMVGLYVGNGSAGDFADLALTPKAKP